MIKYIALILATVLTLSLTACSLRYKPVVISEEPAQKRAPETKKSGISVQKPVPKDKILEQEIKPQALEDKQPETESKPPDATLPSQDQEKQSPRMMASLEITKQARALIDRRKPDDAISMIERAISIDPSNGQNYFYLAEAWLMKGNPAHALEFNGLAGVYLSKDPNWMEKVADQKERINRLKKGKPRS